MEAALGQIVYSRAGRDAGRKFIILGIIDEAYVLISDGDLRRIERPKKKKIKHLVLTEEVAEPLRERLVNKQKITNSDIRKTLTAMEES